MRFAATRNTMYNHQPFTGQGVSLYITTGTTVKYRRLRLIAGSILRGTEFDCGASSVLKTARLTSAVSPVASFSVAKATYAGTTISIDVRQYKDGVENETVGYQTITLDGSGDPVAAINGTATLLSTEQRDGGIVRIRFVWLPALTGLQPETFTAIRTAGPTSPANVDYTAGTGRQLIEIDTPALSDASPYTYKIRATSGATTSDVLTGISVTADATGPTAPTVVAEEW